MKKLIYLFLLITVSASADDSINTGGINNKPCDMSRNATDCGKSPGCYWNGRGEYNGKCKLCPAGYYCDGDGDEDNGNITACEVPEDCPPGSSVGIASGSAKKPGWYRELDTLKSAKCPRGYYCPGDSYVPLKCPNGTSSCKGSSKDLHCTSSLLTLMNCLMNCPEPEKCPEQDRGIGYRELSRDELCEQQNASSCEETQGCVWKVEVINENCGVRCTEASCKAEYGYTWDKWGCKDNNGVTIAQCCEANAFCEANEGGPESMPVAGLCPEGEICLGNNTMATCLCKPPDGIAAVVGTTGFGAKDMTDCIATCDYFTTKDNCYKAKGCYWNGSQCQYCPKGSFCDGDPDGPHTCPYGSTSYPGSVSITECYIEEISVSSFDGDNYKLGGKYYFNGYNMPLGFKPAKFNPDDMAGSVCK